MVPAGVRLGVLVAAGLASLGAPNAAAPEGVSPLAAVSGGPGGPVYVACAGTREIAVIDPSTLRVGARFALRAAPSGIALSPDGRRLYVTGGGPEGSIAILDAGTGGSVGSIPAGHTPVGPVPGADGHLVYFCNRFDGTLAAGPARGGKPLYTRPAGREPIAAVLTPDGGALLVARHLPEGPSDGPSVGASVAVARAATGIVEAVIRLPDGSTSLREIRLSPDGRLAAVPHVLGRLNLPTTQVERGWMNTNALTLIDVGARRALNTVLLDEVDRGAAVPWGVAWTPDGRYILVTHDGSHELSVIDAPALLDKLRTMPAAAGAELSYVTPAARTAADVPSDLTFLTGLRRRVALAGRGPRSVAVAGGRAFVANYFSDSVSVVDIGRAREETTIALGRSAVLSGARLGEAAFHDATLCFQGWQSCASCHPDARADGLHWDLLNDGLGNPKNTKSLLASHRTPPSMSAGVRESAETAVRAGFLHILFTTPPEPESRAIDLYLASLAPVPSPRLARGKPSPAAERGRKLFFDPEVGCGACHPGELYTDLREYDVGTRGPLDPAGEFDTPALVEIWRTAPYLHDGRSATMLDVLKKDNPADRHGRTSHLTPRQLEDLAEFVLSL